MQKAGKRRTFDLAQKPTLKEAGRMAYAARLAKESCNDT